MNQGIVYKLTSGSLIYIGSTERTLQQRLQSGHHRAFKKYGLDYDHFSIDILEVVSYKDKNELFKIEGEHMKKYNCVNKDIPQGYGKNKKDYDRNRYLNKNRIEESKIYYAANKDNINQRRRELHKFKRDWGDLLSIKTDIFNN